MHGPARLEAGDDRGVLALTPRRVEDEALGRRRALGHGQDVLHADGDAVERAAIGAGGQLGVGPGGGRQGLVVEAGQVRAQLAVEAVGGGEALPGQLDARRSPPRSRSAASVTVSGRSTVTAPCSYAGGAMANGPDLAAGDFSAWLSGDAGGPPGRAGRRRALRRLHRVLHVVAVRPHRAGRDRHAGPHPRRARCSRRPACPGATCCSATTSAGHCPMLVDGRCSIYEHRPRTCRTYDCRVFPAAGLERRSAGGRRAGPAVALRAPDRRRPRRARGGAGRRRRAARAASPRRRRRRVAVRRRRGRTRASQLSQDSPVSNIWPMRMALPNGSRTPKSMPYGFADGSSVISTPRPLSVS